MTGLTEVQREMGEGKPPNDCSQARAAGTSPGVDCSARADGETR
jgi:hypothetical protein